MANLEISPSSFSSVDSLPLLPMLPRFFIFCVGYCFCYLGFSAPTKTHLFTYLLYCFRRLSWLAFALNLSLSLSLSLNLGVTITKAYTIDNLRVGITSLELSCCKLKETIRRRLPYFYLCMDVEYKVFLFLSLYLK